ncbi:FtsX-like permease family protein [Clostridium ganghwense]|uniref:FtsX-like permease family protein n=1 Tax=Clostridium ganghwense TaxID=312089 RepID=A0ABT4CJY8_9CLOT|nr:FtsX-like permease family protein [Clostridium ganghwense]MCY6369362.1 FtsX-like permease family protein [Clostridium ganghwense]
MYFKMAVNNIKKSFKDYAIYFITLTLAVCIFYNFNSIDSQTVMYEMNNYQLQSISVLSKGISYISIFISIVFGGLIIYANNSLVKKRKKEFGIYATLGMAKRKISLILICETLIVGIISLIVGLLLGIVLSQGISVLTGKLFEFTMTEYKFIVSMSTINKTIMYFGIMFMLVMIFNTIVVSKHKLIDMINASKKNEDLKLRKPIISVIIFILALIVLGRAYYLGWKFALTPKNTNFPLSIILGSLGTLLFFFGLAGVILVILRKSKKIYLKKLNIFVIKQFNNKINTNFISMAIICLMLFLTIVMLSSSLSFKHEVEKRLKNVMPFDAEIELRIPSDNKQEVKDIREALKKVGFELKDYYKYNIIDFYGTKVKTSSLLNEYANENLKKRLRNYAWELGAVKISQYNEMRKLRGESTIDLKENEVLLITDDVDENETLQNLIKNKKEIKIDNKNYIIKNNIGIKEDYYGLTAVVPDSLVKNMTKYSSKMHINVSEKNKEELDDAVREIEVKFKNVDYERDKLLKKYGFIISAYTKTGMDNKVKSAVGTYLYIGIYLGFVFLISSAAILAIQQLTEASDSLNRYKALKNFGASDDMINKSIFAQIFIHFMLPLGLALIHFAVALQIIKRMSEYAGVLTILDIGPTMMVTAGVIIIIYGGYFYATYLGYKNIVKNN